MKQAMVNALGPLTHLLAGLIVLSWGMALGVVAPSISLIVVVLGGLAAAGHRFCGQHHRSAGRPDLESHRGTIWAPYDHAYSLGCSPAGRLLLVLVCGSRLVDHRQCLCLTFGN